MRVSLLHYSCPPVVGGVEAVIVAHARLFAADGHDVQIIAGAGAADVAEGIGCTLIPELAASGIPPAVREELASGRAGPAFAELRARLREQLGTLLARGEVVIVHNMMTMPFQLAATAALADLAAERGGATRFINWIHDLAAIDPHYALGDRLTMPPWDLLARDLDGFHNVAVSEHRRDQFCELTGIGPDGCRVVPNGIDLCGWLGLGSKLDPFVQRGGLLDRDLILLQPARLVRRKKIELGVQVLAALCDAGVDAAYLVTGAPDPHNRAAAAYAAELRALVAELGIGHRFHFVGDALTVDDAEMAALYRLCDAVFLPSGSEGFGLPVLEAALNRCPVFCTAAGPMAGLLESGVHTFASDMPPAAIAARLVGVLHDDAAHRARQQVLRDYSWRQIYQHHIRPLLVTGEPGCPTAPTGCEVR